MSNGVTKAWTSKTRWGKIDGKDAWLFCLTNKRNTKLYVSNFGATVQSLYFTDREGGYDDIILGYDRLQDYERDRFYMGSVVGRYANRIAGGNVVIDGRQYSLATKEGGYHLHGGEQGFNRKLFDFSIEDTDESGIVKFTYVSQDMEEGFPGELHLEVIYTLDEFDTWTVEYRARTDKTTIVNLTQHVYFNLLGNPADTVDGHELKIPGAYYLPVNKLQVPTGSLQNVENTPFDFSSFKRIGTDITQEDEQLQMSSGYDHSFVLEKVHTPLLKHAAIVKEPLSGRKVDVYTTEPAVHLYTGNYLENVKGKKGATYNRRSGLCLETQHFPDSPNHSHFPSTVLKAGEEFYSKTIFNLSIY